VNIPFFAPKSMSFIPATPKYEKSEKK
jgi:hypothetical protein